MTDDLIARLRERVIYDSRHYTPDPLLKEAADRIEALTAEVERLTLTVRKLQGHQVVLEAEVKGLRGALEERMFLYYWRAEGMNVAQARIHARAALEGTSDA